MATVNKDFKVKNGLIVEGTTGTINNYNILTESQDSQDFIVDLIGGQATSTNTPDTVVKRDGSGNFAAGTITADLTGDVTGTVSSLSNHDTDDLAEGTTNKYYTDGRVKNVLTGSTQTNISITEIGGVLHITAENGVTDSTTDDLDEGTTNKYFTEQRARDSVSAGDGLDYNSATGEFSADLKSAGGLHIDATEIAIDRTTVDTWYDANGAAADVQDNLDNHTNASSGVHGVTGSVVGTSDTQSLSNKTFLGQTNFQSGGGAGGTANHIDVNNTTGDMTITSGYALNLTSSNDLTVTSNGGDIVLNPDGGAYIGSVSAGNTIATNSYVDNAVSGLDWKTAVNLLANSDKNMTGSTGTLVIDGHAALTTSDVGYRILLTNQSVDSENGIYTYTESAGVYTLVRADDADAFGELVGAAVFVMEGTTYGQTSWVQANHYLTDFTAQDWVQFSGSGSIVAGNGITVDGLEVSVDRTTVDTWYDAAGTASDLVGDHNNLTSGVHGVAGDVVGTSDSQTLTNKSIDGGNNTLSNIANASLVNDSITVNGYSTALGSSVTLDTNDISEGTTNKYYTDQRVRNVLTGSTQTNISISEVSGQLIITAENGVADSTTDDLAEGVNNHYFTDNRAKDAAGYLLENSTQSNISISYDENTRQLTVTAENGVADSTTDDLDEGTNNLYFTNQRAVDALEGVVPNFTEIDINSVATQIAAQTAVATASTVTAYQFAHADYRSAKFLVKGQTSSHTEISEVLVTLDASNNIAITEYAMVGTNGNLVDVSADINGSNVRLLVTTVNNNTDVTVVGTLLA